MNRNDFQKLARVRLEDAKLLCENGGFGGSYYLAGYCIECALKACIAKRTQPEQFPPKARVVQKYYSHDLAGLLAAAELERELEEKSSVAPIFQESWAIVKEWNEDSRYEFRSEAVARGLIEAIDNKTNEVLPWLQEYW